MNNADVVFSMLKLDKESDYPFNPELLPCCMIYESDLLIHHTDQMEALVANIMKYEKRLSSDPVVVGEVTEDPSGFNLSGIKPLDWDSSSTNPLTVIESKLYERLEFGDGSYTLESYFDHKKRAVMFSRSRSWIFLVKQEYEWAIFGFHPLNAKGLVETLVQNSRFESFRLKSLKHAMTSNPGVGWIFRKHSPVSAIEARSNFKPHFWGNVNS